MRSGESKGLSIDLAIGVILEVLKISLEVIVEDNELRSQGLGVVAAGRVAVLLGAAQISAPPQQANSISTLFAWYDCTAVHMVGGCFEPSKSKDREEAGEIRRMHMLIEKYQLRGQIRWIAAQTDRQRNGEIYRAIADTKGAFVQPALYEAFGLTVIEAMNCGLPTFATNQGGPAEIIVDGVSGFHIDPNNGEESSNKIADFFQKCTEE
nr:sucrose synthase [Ipomoea batatas]